MPTPIPDLVALMKEVDDDIDEIDNRIAAFRERLKTANLLLRKAQRGCGGLPVYWEIRKFLELPVLK